MGNGDDRQEVICPPAIRGCTLGWAISPVAASIEIHWPSGIVQTLTNVKGDRQVQVDEPGVSNPAPTR